MRINLLEHGNGNLMGRSPLVQEATGSFTGWLADFFSIIFSAEKEDTPGGHSLQELSPLTREFRRKYPDSSASVSVPPRLPGVSLLISTEDSSFFKRTSSQDSLLVESNS